MKKSILLLLLFTLLPMFGSAKVLIDGIYYNLSGGTASVTYTGDIWSVGSYSGEVEIPETVTYNGVTYTVTSIGESAFYKCQDLIGVIIPTSVTSIGRVAFVQSTNLKSLIIPNSVTSIGESAFQGCSSLKDVKLSSTLTTINKGMFYSCTSLTHIEIPESIITIGEQAFSACTNLTNITIPNSVTRIGQSAFAGCSRIDTLLIPSSVVFIDQQAFASCNNLKSIIVSNDNHYYDSRDDCNAIINTSSNTLITGCYTSIIPYSVTAIGYGAFSGCNALRYTSITFPEPIKIIDDHAFYNTYISSMFFLGDIDRIGNWAFLCEESATIDYLAFFGNINNPIGDKAFWQRRRYTNAGQRNIINLIIGSSVDSIKGLNIKPGSNIYSFNPIPPEADESTFLNYNSTVHVPPTALPAYFSAPYWSNFENIIGDAVEPIGVTISKDTINLRIGDDPVSLSASVTPSNANPNIILWNSTNNKVATVYNGSVTAVKSGECDIIAQCLNKQAICHVVVNDTTVTITLDKQEAMVLPNHIITLTPSASPVMPDGFAVSSSNPAVAIARVVNNKVQVVGLKEGTTLFTVGSIDGTAIPATCLVTVYTELGDVNCDGYVNISDVTDLIDFLLYGNYNNVSLVNADCDKDEKVNISDVTMLIDYLLGGVDLNPPACEIFTVNGVSFKMVSVEGGTFTMGATEEQGDDANNNERPTHQVTLSDYSICETEVTQELWIAVMGSGGFWCSVDRGFTDIPNRPADCMNHRKCQEFITKLNEMTGKNFRLPTEAEWEYAARGGNRSRGYKYAGSNNINEIAWYASNSSAVGDDSPDYGTHSVGSKKPNELGLYDMSGNVCELVQDTYDSYSSNPQTNPVGHGSYSSHRVYRGGAWINDAGGCRVSWRAWYESSNAPYNFGFRLAL